MNACIFQEFDIDVHAVSLLVNLANERRDLFCLGFAWGGLADMHTRDIRPFWYDGTTGTATQGKR